MPAIDDLTELVERAAAAERIALASKWKDRPDVEKMVRRVRKTAAEQRDELSKNTDGSMLSSRWVSLRQDYLDLGEQEFLPGESPGDVDPDVDEPDDQRVARSLSRRPPPAG